MCGAHERKRQPPSTASCSYTSWANHLDSITTQVAIKRTVLGLLATALPQVWFDMENIYTSRSAGVTLTLAPLFYPTARYMRSELEQH